jgi:SGNH hydrolase-like domain, acetyltransferase AlgX
VRRVAGRVALAAAGLVAGALLGEGALRLYRPWAPLPFRAFVEEEVGSSAAYALRVAPGARPLLRESDFALPADVVAVGDSMTFGSLVLEGEAFPQRLAQMTGRRVLNLGRPTAGPCVYGRMLELALARLPQPPRTVLYVLFANDAVEGPCRPMREDELFAWEAGARTSPRLRWRELRERALGGSVAYQLAKRWLSFRGLHVGGSFEPVLFEREGARFAFAPPGYWRPLTDLRSPRVEAGLAETMGKIEEARDRCLGVGARLVLVLMPSKEQVYLPGLVARGELPSESYDSAADELFDTLTARAGAGGIPVRDLRAGLRRAASEGEKLYFSVDGHLTPRGHERVAGLLRVGLADDEP